MFGLCLSPVAFVLSRYPFVFSWYDSLIAVVPCGFLYHMVKSHQVISVQTLYCRLLTNILLLFERRAEHFHSLSHIKHRAGLERATVAGKLLEGISMKNGWLCRSSPPVMGLLY